MGENEWRLSGVLTESQKDTYHFADWTFPAGTVPDSAAGVTLEVSVPEDLADAPKLGVFLRMRGASYFANGVKLNRRGRHQVVLPFSAFRPFGAKRGFAPSDLCDVSVGFGGYVGAAGEMIEFTLTRPKVFK